VDSPCFVIDTAYSVGPIDDSVDRRWLYYCLCAIDFKGISQDVGVPGLSREAAYSTPVPLPPPLSEQRRIADFLDAEVTRLDTLAQFRLRQESLLTERLFARAAILTRRSDAVRQGAAYRGVPLRRALISIRTGLTPTTLRDKSQSTDSDIPWYTPAAVDDLMSIGDADKVVDQGSRGVPTFPKDSILVVGIGESLGKVGYLDHAATGNQQLTALHTVPEVDSRFLAWQLWAVRDELRSWSQYSRVRIINNGSLSSFPIHLPPKSRQITIRIELDNEREHVLAFRQVAAAFAQRLVERKQALITAAVTGQFDVTTARGVDVS